MNSCWQVGDRHPKGVILGIRLTEGREYALICTHDAEWVDVTIDGSSGSLGALDGLPPRRRLQALATLSTKQRLQASAIPKA